MILLEIRARVGMLILNREELRPLRPRKRLLFGILSNLFQGGLQNREFLVGLDMVQIQAHRGQLFWGVDRIVDFNRLVDQNCSMNLGLAIITKSMFGNFIGVNLSGKISISDRLSNEFPVFAQLFKFRVERIYLICLIHTWIRSVVVHGHL